MRCEGGGAEDCGRPDGGPHGVSLDGLDAHEDGRGVKFK